MAIEPLITVQILATKKDGKAVLLLFCVVLEEYVLQHEENREDVHNGEISRHFLQARLITT